mmetsp:Transcript_14872/g.41408  ORF Transcript_14872/g.41408 Transcript_14872/m.41408 type:complete len:300 (-) Transcript_14872:927-1826(-)
MWFHQCGCGVCRSLRGGNGPLGRGYRKFVVVERRCVHGHQLQLLHIPEGCGISDGLGWLGLVPGIGLDRSVPTTKFCIGCYRRGIRFRNRLGPIPILVIIAGISCFRVGFNVQTFSRGCRRNRCRLRIVCFRRRECRQRRQRCCRHRRGRRRPCCSSSSVVRHEFNRPRVRNTGLEESLDPDEGIVVVVVVIIDLGRRGRSHPHGTPPRPPNPWPLQQHTRRELDRCHAKVEDSQPQRTERQFDPNRRHGRIGTVPGVDHGQEILAVLLEVAVTVVVAVVGAIIIVSPVAVQVVARIRE